MLLLSNSALHFLHILGPWHPYTISEILTVERATIVDRPTDTRIFGPKTFHIFKETHHLSISYFRIKYMSIIASYKLCGDYGEAIITTICLLHPSSKLSPFDIKMFHVTSMLPVQVTGSCTR